LKAEIGIPFVTRPQQQARSGDFLSQVVEPDADSFGEGAEKSRPGSPSMGF